MNHIRRANGIATRPRPNFGQTWTQLISSWPLFVCYRAAIPSRLQVTEGRVIGAQKLMRDSGWRRNWGGGRNKWNEFEIAPRGTTCSSPKCFTVFLFPTIPLSFSLDMRVGLYTDISCSKFSNYFSFCYISLAKIELTITGQPRKQRDHVLNNYNLLSMIIRIVPISMSFTSLRKA